MMMRVLFLMCMLASVAAFAPVRNIARQSKVASPKVIYVLNLHAPILLAPLSVYDDLSVHYVYR